MFGLIMVFQAVITFKDFYVTVPYEKLEPDRPNKIPKVFLKVLILQVFLPAADASRVPVSFSIREYSCHCLRIFRV